MMKDLGHRFRPSRGLDGKVGLAGLLAALLALAWFPALSWSVGDDKPASRKVNAPPGPPRPGDAARMTVHVTASKREYRPLEPIELDIVIENVSKKEHIKMQMDWAVYPTIKIAVTDEVGRVVPKTEYLKYVGGTSGTTGIMAGGTYRPKLLANLVNDMTAPGEYSIIVKVPFWSNANADFWRMGESEPIKVKVRGEPFTGHDEPAEPEK